MKAQFPSILKHTDKQRGREKNRQSDNMKDNKHRMNGPTLVPAEKINNKIKYNYKQAHGFKTSYQVSDKIIKQFMKQFMKSSDLFSRDQWACLSIPMGNL